MVNLRWFYCISGVNLKLKFLSISLLIVTLSGCAKKNKAEGTVREPVKTSMKTDGYKGDESVNIFDENLEAFVLEEDVNPLAKQEQVPTNSDSFEKTFVNGTRSAGAKTVYFDFDRYSLKKAEQDAIEYDLNLVKSWAAKGKTVVLEGHACNSAGSDVYNLMLSERRAQSIKDYFVSKGIAQTKLKTVGRGSEMPIVPFGDQEQQSPNRRVEIYLEDSVKA